MPRKVRLSADGKTRQTYRFTSH